MEQNQLALNLLQETSSKAEVNRTTHLQVDKAVAILQALVTPKKEEKTDKKGK